MPPRPTEPLAQAEYALRLRAAIDTARKYPSGRNVNTAVDLARSQPQALRSSHVRHNLGVARWEWLTDHLVFAAGEGGEFPGSIKGTITPDVLK